MSKKNLIKIIYIIFKELFFVSGIVLIILLLIEDLHPGFVSFWFKIEHLLTIVFIFGILTLFTSGIENDKIRE